MLSKPQAVALCPGLPGSQHSTEEAELPNWAPCAWMEKTPGSLAPFFLPGGDMWPEVQARVRQQARGPGDQANLLGTAGQKDTTAAGKMFSPGPQNKPGHLPSDTPCMSDTAENLEIPSRRHKRGQHGK